LGEFEEVVDRISRSLRLNPADPHSYSMHSALAFAHFFAGRYTEALSWAEMAVREKPSYLLAACIVPASFALAGRRDAEKAIARVRELDPGLRLSNLNNLTPIGRPEDFAKWEEGLRLAGLPE